MPVVIWVEPETLPFSVEEVQPLLAPDIEHRLLRMGDAADARNFEVAVIPALAEASLRTARVLHKAAPWAHIVFAGGKEEARDLRSRLLLAPRIGRHWTVLEAPGAAAAAEAIARAVRAVRGQRQLRTTLDRMNVRLSTESDPAKLRKLAISDRFLASLLSQAADPILALDLSGRIESANDAAASFFGRELRSRDLTGLLSESGAEQLASHIEAKSEGRFRSAIAGDEGRALELSISTVRAQDGSPIGFSVIARDISGEQRSARISEFLDSTSEILFSSLDWSQTFDRAARAAVPFLGELCVIDLLEDGQLVRKTVAASTPDLVGPGLELGQPVELHPEHPASRVMKTGQPASSVIEPGEWNRVAPKSPASSRPGKASLNLPLRIRGRVEGAISFLSWSRTYDTSDINTGMEFARRVALALDNARLYQEAERANRSKDEFLATLSHELRTPMTAILGWSRMLEMNAVDPDIVAEAVLAIRRSAESQAQLIDDLLDVSRIVAGKMRLEVEDVAIESLVEAAANTVRPAAEARAVEIELDVDDSVTVRGDPSRLQQVIWNLLTNAVKFTPKGGKVSVVGERVASSVEIRVTDTGQGIPPEFLPKMFERFRQVDSSTRRALGGLGLGLAIVRHLVELHGGSVSAESEGEGKGATFTVVLPIAATFEKAPDEPHHEMRAPGRPRGGDELPGLDGVSILVVEDDTEARRLIGTVLRSAGATVRAVESVELANRELDQHLPDLLISDIGMPGQDGFDLIRGVRQRPADKRLPALALTAYGRPEERDRILAAGFDSYLMKPVDPVDLARTAAEILARNPQE